MTLKRWFILWLMFGLASSLVSCQGEAIGVDMIWAIESKYQVDVLDVYASARIDPNYENVRFSHLTKDMEEQLENARHVNRCEQAWLIVSYVKTDLGDRLAFSVREVKSETQLENAVIMIDYPYEYTREDMKDYLLSLELAEPLLIDFDTFQFRFQYKHAPTITPEPNLIDRILQRSCFATIDTTHFAHLNPDFNPALDLDSAFVWIFTGRTDRSETNESPSHTPLWITGDDDYTIYRVFVIEDTLYVTMANETTPERYIHPIQEDVV